MSPRVIRGDGNGVKGRSETRPQADLPAPPEPADAVHRCVPHLHDPQRVVVQEVERLEGHPEHSLPDTVELAGEPGVQGYRSGNSSILVYQSTYAGTSRATTATWVVGDVDRTVAALKQRGIAFEQYDLPDSTWQGDVMVSGKIRSAWFKDPDGNVLALVNS